MSRHIVLLAVLALVAGCTGAPPGATPQPSPPSATPTDTATPVVDTPGAGRTPLTVGLGYIPNVQFAQFYRAERQGYYRAAGLDVTFQHGIDPELITLIGQGAVDIGMGDGTSVIPAASQGIPIRYVATVYAQFPSVVIADQDSGISAPAHLAGRSLGIPGRFGSSWIMLQALLASADLTPDDLDITLYPDFGQAVALREGQVEAATGFANNEPIQLWFEGMETTVLRVDEVVGLPGPGLIVGKGTLREKEDAVRRFVAATLRAMEEIIADPQLGLEDAIAAVPDLAQAPDRQLAVLQATVEMWQSAYTEQHGLGAIDRDGWTESIEFMRSLPESVVTTDLTTDQLVTEELLP